jgi:hypothetical protein
MTHKQAVRNWLNGRDWVPSYEIEKYCANNYMTDGMRRCREMAESGEIERKVEGKFVYYRVKQSAILQKILDIRSKVKVEDIDTTAQTLF